MKKVVLAFNGHETQIDPQFCDHHNAIHFVEIDGERWECPDCGATLDEHFEVVRVGEVEF